jgi:hypothetical protein
MLDRQMRERRETSGVARGDGREAAVDVVDPDGGLRFAKVLAVERRRRRDPSRDNGVGIEPGKQRRRREQEEIAILKRIAITPEERSGFGTVTMERMRKTVDFINNNIDVPGEKLPAEQIYRPGFLPEQPILPK